MPEITKDSAECKTESIQIIKLLTEIKNLLEDIKWTGIFFENRAGEGY